MRTHAVRGLKANLEENVCSRSNKQDGKRESIGYSSKSDDWFLSILNDSGVLWFHYEFPRQPFSYRKVILQLLELIFDVLYAVVLFRV